MPHRKPFSGKTVILILLAFCLSIISYGQATDSLKNRKIIIAAGNGLAYTSTMTGLYFLWYADYPMGKFRFFNDNAEWLQMDKCGHAFSCYYEGVVGKKMMQWAGYSDKASTLIGGSYGFIIQTSVEVLDGFSKNWGASWGDITANGIGTGLFIGQEFLWQDQRLLLKFSYAPSTYSSLRPNVLGGSFVERLMKDYNGQTYWLSGNIHSFLNEESAFPKWLNLAVGYGADGMIGGFSNTFNQNGIIYNYNSIARQRQFFLSPDIDLSKIPVKKKWLKTCFTLLNCLKLPAPALMLQDNKLKTILIAY